MSLQDRRRRTQEFLAQPDAADIVLDAFVESGSILSLCDWHQLRYYDVINWLNSDARRKADFQLAFDARKDRMVEELLNEIRQIALFDIRDLYDEDGALKNVKQLPKHIAKALQGIESEEVHVEGVKVGETKKVKLWDKLKAVELLGKQLNMFIQRTEVTGRVTLEDLVSKSFTSVESKAISGD